MTSAPTFTSVREWNEPPALAPRGTVVLVAGRGENPSVYERFGQRIAADAYRVRAVGDPTVDPSATQAELHRLTSSPDVVHPVVLAGSDAGALFAAALVATGRIEADALILAGLPTDGGAARTERADDWEQELTDRTACPTHRARLDSDTGIRHGAVRQAPPAEWFEAADLSEVTVPILGLHGADDAISPLDLVRDGYRAAPSVQLVSIDGGRHDALNDATHRTAAATVVLFLERVKRGADAAAIARVESLGGTA